MSSSSKAKIILCAKYLEAPEESSLDYDNEINRYKLLISKLQSISPQLTTDEAYLAIKNYYSSINTYSISTQNPLS